MGHTARATTLWGDEVALSLQARATAAKEERRCIALICLLRCHRMLKWLRPLLAHAVTRSGQAMERRR